MADIFITNIQNKVRANSILNTIKKRKPELQVSIDLNKTENTYPCGHTLLRLENDIIDSETILKIVRNLG